MKITPFLFLKQVAIIVILIFAQCFTALSQDSAYTINKVIPVEGVGKDEIYNKALVWFSQSLNDSKSAIDVQDKEAGILAGKAFIESNYKIPGKKDSIASYDNGKYQLSFVVYRFDWLLEIKDGKARMTISHIENNYLPDTYLPIEYSVPGLPMQDKKKVEIQWKYSKLYFPGNIDRLIAGLQKSILKPVDSF